ncbi:c-type cytochrome [Sphingomonas azotifigens]|uniref:c-type cytochrome n=1 Tax=Sphingomonas azotifigens TaxID=330920 RepID=UPI000A0268D9|nr:cytochrome c [Sphingomonas azotifigens]
MTKIKILCAVSCVALLAAASAPAAGPSADSVVAARKAGFKKIGGAMKAIRDQLASGGTNKPVMVSAAQTMAATAREQAKLFPAGTGPGAGVKTDALPAIWSDRATFDAAMNRLIAESTKLATVAGSGDSAAITAQLKATGATCAACHKQFRADN